VLKKVLPEHLGFTAIVIRGQNDVVLTSATGDFVVDAVSGGLSAIIDLAWQIYLRSTDGQEMTVVIDEVENHLHASMQRRLLPSFIDAFPKVQFIVSTHSPLIVGSVQNSAVYALRYNAEKRVFSTRLDLKEKAKAANDILREVLDVPVTLPLWAEKKIDEIVSKYRKADLDKVSLAAFKQDLTNAGLQDMTTEAFVRLAGGQQ
jgi:predicted ATP-binding protein involved in virulence